MRGFRKAEVTTNFLYSHGGIHKQCLGFGNGFFANPLIDRFSGFGGYHLTEIVGMEILLSGVVLDLE